MSEELGAKNQKPETRNEKPETNRRDLSGIESCFCMTAVAERLVLRLAAAAEIDGWKLIFLILFALMVEEFCAAGHFGDGRAG